MSSEELRPVGWLVVNGAIKEAYCSLCHDDLYLGKDLGSPEEQKAKLKDVFERHVNSRHFPVAAADRVQHAVWPQIVLPPSHPD